MAMDTVSQQKVVSLYLLLCVYYSPPLHALCMAHPYRESCAGHQSRQTQESQARQDEYVAQTQLANIPAPTTHRQAGYDRAKDQEGDCHHEEVQTSSRRQAVGGHRRRTQREDIHGYVPSSCVPYLPIFARLCSHDEPTPILGALHFPFLTSVPSYPFDIRLK